MASLASGTGAPNASAAAQPSVPEAPPYPALPTTKLTRQDELARVQSLVKRIGPSLSGNMPPSHPLTVQEARRVRFGIAERTLATVFATATTQCFLLVLDVPQGVGELLPGLDYQNCRRQAWVAEDDLNGDGVVDLLYELVLPSNRHAADVSEYAFYVSDRARRSYCHAKALEGVLGLVEFPIRPGALRTAAEQLVAARGRAVLHCTSSSP